MTKIVLAFLISFTLSYCYCQTSDSTKIKRDSSLGKKTIKEKQSKADSLTYTDTTFNFQVKAPKWLNIKQTGTIYAWGGTLPAVDGIENAIVVKSFDKKDYKSMKEFKKYVVEGLVFGQAPQWSNSFIFMGKKDIGKYKSNGVAYKVYLKQGNLMYHCKYVLLESSTSYIWIDFTSTQETFDKNIDKFEEFLDGFKITKL